MCGLCPHDSRRRGSWWEVDDWMELKVGWMIVCLNFFGLKYFFFFLRDKVGVDICFLVFLVVFFVVSFLYGFCIFCLWWFCEVCWLYCWLSCFATTWVVSLVELGRTSSFRIRCVDDRVVFIPFCHSLWCSAWCLFYPLVQRNTVIVLHVVGFCLWSIFLVDLMYYRFLFYFHWLFLCWFLL